MLYIYNDSTKLFLEKVKDLAIEILTIEMKLDFKKSRLLYKAIYYPINFVSFEAQKILGFYDPILFQIGINKIFIHKYDKEILKNIIRHELAHFFVHIEHGLRAQAHGPEFRKVFRDFNWNTDFSKSNISLEKEQEIEEAIVKKIQKLLSLAESTNEHEALVATTKANDLITKHNLENLKGGQQEDTYVARVFEYKKKNSKADGIYEILKEFNVYPVFNQGHKGGYLDIVGAKTDVLIAHYIADYLSNSIDSIWKRTKKENTRLKGVVAKNSFIHAFCSSVAKQLRDELLSSQSHELICLKNELSLRVLKVYPQVRSSYSNRRKSCSLSSKLGKDQAKDFSISKAISSKTKEVKKIFFKK